MLKNILCQVQFFLGAKTGFFCSGRKYLAISFGCKHSFFLQIENNLTFLGKHLDHFINRNGRVFFIKMEKELDFIT